MTDDRSHLESLSRRRFLGAAAGTGIAATTAGCLETVLGSSSDNRIQPQEPTEPRRGSPGEFYYFLEENGIAVESLARDGKDLVLVYESEAETVDESNQEIRVIYEVFRRALIERGSDVEFLYTEIANPFDGQAHGWGIDAKWVRYHDGGGSDANESQENETVSDGGETSANETNESGPSMNWVLIWSNIMNSKVYEEDIEAVQDD